jgi:hypothetical protein
LTQKRLPRQRSNYFSILLDCGGLHGGRRYFKFENMWLKSEGFVVRVKQWWTSYHFQGSLIYILARKFKALKVYLNAWNEEVFGNVERKKKLLMEDLWVLEGLKEGRGPSEEGENEEVYMD